MRPGRCLTVNSNVIAYPDRHGVRNQYTNALNDAKRDGLHHAHAEQHDISNRHGDRDRDGNSDRYPNRHRY